MSDRIVYVCPFCSHEGKVIFRKGKVLSCMSCEAPLDYEDHPDWVPESTVFFKRPDGTYTMPGHRDARVPAEYERVEVQDTHEKRRIVREIDREHREKWGRAEIGRQMMSEQLTPERRAELRHAMQQGRVIEDENGKRFVGPMREELKDFARYAMKQNDGKPRRRYRGGFILTALEMNQQNMEPYVPRERR